MRNPTERFTVTFRPSNLSDKRVPLCEQPLRMCIHVESPVSYKSDDRDAHLFGQENALVSGRRFRRHESYAAGRGFLCHLTVDPAGYHQELVPEGITRHQTLTCNPIDGVVPADVLAPIRHSAVGTERRGVGSAGQAEKRRLLQELLYRLTDAARRYLKVSSSSSRNVSVTTRVPCLAAV